MSGHSHFATIHRQKELNDAKKGKVYSKMGREISIAVRTGGGTDPNFNYKLRVIIDKAREFNMPKSNIERAINSAASGDVLEEMSYEGFGPGGIAVIVQAATDNKNRTAQEIKNAFERAGGSLAGPGAVSFNFENKGLLILAKDADPQTQMLKLIDFGIEDVEEVEDTLEVYVAPDRLSEMHKKLEEGGFTIKQAELYMRPINWMTVTDANTAQKAMNFLEILDELDDVQKVFSNLDIPDASK